MNKGLRKIIPEFRAEYKVIKTPSGVVAGFVDKQKTKQQQKGVYGKRKQTVESDVDLRQKVLHSCVTCTQLYLFETLPYFGKLLRMACYSCIIYPADTLWKQRRDIMTSPRPEYGVVSKICGVCFFTELDDYSYSQRNLEMYTKRLWQQRVKTETVDMNDDIDEQGGYSPTRSENYFFDNYYGGDSDTFREHLEYSLKRSADDQLSPASSGVSVPTPTKRGRGRPYKEVSVKITCLRPEDNKASSLTVDFSKLQEEGLGML